ncbi:MAG: hypothetical protein J6U54_05240 [Clostridiales bacterium]|nr:hypothetical protein [Clostridiales bacterium]
MFKKNENKNETVNNENGNGEAVEPEKKPIFTKKRVGIGLGIIGTFILGALVGGLRKNSSDEDDFDSEDDCDTSDEEVSED